MDAYRVRRTLFETESVLAVDGGALNRTDGKGATERLELNTVRRVSLSYQPLTSVDRWVCSVEASGHRIWFPSASFTGPGQTEDRRAAFRAFVEGLSLTIANQPTAATVRFRRGSALSSYGALVMLIVIAILLVLLVLAVIGALISHEGGSSLTWVGLPGLVLLAAARMLWRVWRRNPSGDYDPRAIPATFAPPN